MPGGRIPAPLLPYFGLRLLRQSCVVSRAAVVRRLLSVYAGIGSKAFNASLVSTSDFGLCLLRQSCAVSGAAVVGRLLSVYARIGSQGIQCQPRKHIWPRFRLCLLRQRCAVSGAAVVRRLLSVYARIGSQAFNASLGITSGRGEETAVCVCKNRFVRHSMPA